MSALLASDLQTRWTAALFLHLKLTLGYTEMTFNFCFKKQGWMTYRAPIKNRWKGNFIIKLKDKKYKTPILQCFILSLRKSDIT